ncbi:hypothetical protein AXF12_07450 [Capnocytophaga haemolytica]|uniref:Uncharacterized protein n=1 Tax=Capnocytophaga haemolytica TaxID=45243 RepID=A0ABN4KD73_9FLAO|nr:hypothetical protein [Capnocytophaga haemolytica]AMD85357.1 hypothetical protein AXF12_07450 [Capnocytophaga haemolytica]
MKLKHILLTFLAITFLPTLSAQDRDTTYIQPYPQDIWLKAFIPTKLLMVSQDKKTYLPSTSFSFGVAWVYVRL